MKHDVRSKLIAIILLVLVVLPVFSCNVNAAINENYQSRYEDAGTDDLIDEKIKESTVIDMLASFVYSLASLVEKLVGTAFKSLTGSATFPWADRILFNAVPLLDVNFFNADGGSLYVQNDGILGRIVRNTYFTILSIAVAFLGIVVAIAAIKMAISSLASEKAKYKEALTKWLFSIVMLFLMHNIMSFVFFLNEKMVEIASNIMSESLDTAAIKLIEEATSIDADTAISTFLETNKEHIGNETADAKETIENNKEIANKLISSESYRDSILFDAFKYSSQKVRNWFKETFTGNGKQSIIELAVDINLINGQSIEYGVTEITSTDEDGTFVNTTTEKKTITIKELIDSLNNKSDDELQKTDGYEFFLYHISKFELGDSKHTDVSYYKQYVNIMTTIYNDIYRKEATSTSPDLMASLAKYFKESAFVIPTDDDTGEVTGWYRSKLTVQGALLYAIFVAQSILYFFSYIRRFFYIVVLSIMAPAIVVIDFLSKS